MLEQIEGIDFKNCWIYTFIMRTKKCLPTKPCIAHKDGKYLKWKCNEIYSPQDRHQRFIKNKINCEKCGEPSTAKICKKCYYKFNKHFLKGKKLPKWWIKRIKETIPKGEKHPAWKGEEAVYSAKHRWMTRHYSNPKKCSECGVKGKKNKNNRWTIQWANISGEYKRDVKDYKGLCTKCHSLFDGKTKSINDFEHGTNKRYRRGCRCELCRNAKHLYRNKLIKYN